MLNVGDKVKVKDFYDIAGLLDAKHKTRELYFAKSMVDMCGKIYKISNTRHSATTNSIVYDIQSNAGDTWTFIDEWLIPQKRQGTLEDVCNYDEEMAGCFAEKIREKWNIIVIDLPQMIETDELKENATYRTRYMRDVKLEFTTNNPNVDEYFTHAVVMESYGFIDAVCEECVNKILQK